MQNLSERPHEASKETLPWLSPRVLGVLGLLLVLGFVGLASPQARAAEATNKCGCYQDSTGSCFCNKNATCGCPGSCEPKGCEEKREKQMQKEIDAEMRKAQAAAHHGGPVTKSGPSADPDREAESASRRSQAGKTKVVPLTPTQRKQLLHLLDLYSAERGGGSRTLDQVRDDLNAGAR